MDLQELPNPSDSVAFGPFVLNSVRRSLTEDGHQVRLGARAMDLLVALVQGAGRVVTRAELCAFAWPTGEVASATLNVHIGSLRQALRDGQDGLRYIVNVSGRGYQFVAPLTAITQDDGRADAVLRSTAGTGLQRSLVGRDEVLNQLVERIRARRLVTLTGFAGVGKTSVARALAERAEQMFEHGVRFIELAPLTDPGLVPSALAQALGLPVRPGSVIADISKALVGREVLLVMDNCEHVIDAVASLVQTVLTNSDGVKVLATSREALRLPGEQVIALSGLAYPADDASTTAAEALTYPAVQLFERRVRAAIADFRLADRDAAAASAICRQLDGVPLAIELAASHVEALGIQGLPELMGGTASAANAGLRTAPDRHRTMKAAIDWSYRLLAPVEQAVLRKVSVFAGGFSLDAAVSVGGEGAASDDTVAEALAVLAAKSLVAVEADEHVRYRLLEATRSFAAQALSERGEAGDAKLRHAKHFLAALAGVRGMTKAGDVAVALRADLDNVRAALAWSFSVEGDPAFARQLAGASVPMWFALNLLAECHDWMDRAQGLGPQPGEPQEVAQNIQYGGQSSTIFTSGATDDAFGAWMQASSGSPPPEVDSNGLLPLLGPWTVLLRRMELGKASELVVQAEQLASGSSVRDLVATAAWMRSLTSHHQGRFADALASFERFLQEETPAGRQFFLSISGFDRRSGVHLLRGLTNWLLGRTDAGLAECQAGYAAARAVGTDLPICEALQWRGFALFLAGADAAVLEPIAVELGERAKASDFSSHAALASCLSGLAASLRGDPARAAGLLDAGYREVQASRYGPFDPLIVGELAAAMCALGKPGDALDLISEFECSRPEPSSWCAAELLRRKAEAQHLSGLYVESEQTFLDAVELARQQGALSWELRTARSFAELARTPGPRASARNLLTAVNGRIAALQVEAA
ncbi:ATP-binding protein [Roseateles sp.]|uniref:ATP-binding protein n=1 Tax=Roseateles sp. TaxID=1971397 RepID=UPI0039E76F49